MSQIASRGSNLDEIICNPLFKKGYAETWAGEEHAVQRSWNDEEQEAYERGRQFAACLKGEGERHVPLTQGFLANPRAKILLLMAMRSGEVL